MCWRRRFKKFDFDVWYKKGLFATQSDALFRLCLLEEATASIDAYISTSSLPRHVTPTGCECTDYLDTSLAMTTDTSSTIVPTTSVEIGLTIGHADFCRTIHVCLGQERGLPLHLTAIAFCFALSTDLCK